MEFESIAQGYYLEALFIDGTTAWYSDVAQGGIRRLTADGAIQVWLADRRWVGGILLNEDGCVLVSGLGGIVWFNPATAATGVLLDAIDGKPINGVNEMRPDGHGGIYFGTVDLPAIQRGEAPSPVALYRLAADGTLTLLCDGLVFTNGLSLSPEGSRLYHNESFVGTFAYDLALDGSLGKRSMLLKKRDCDGLAVDAAGNLWITGFGSGELVCLLPDGTVARRVKLPGEAATNVRFGGADGRDLYVTVVSPDTAAALADGTLPTSPTSALYRARSEVAGHPIPRTRFRLS